MLLEAKYRPGPGTPFAERAIPRGPPTTSTRSLADRGAAASRTRIVNLTVAAAWCTALLCDTARDVRRAASRSGWRSQSGCGARGGRPGHQTASCRRAGTSPRRAWRQPHRQRQAAAIVAIRSCRSGSTSEVVTFASASTVAVSVPACAGTGIVHRGRGGGCLAGVQRRGRSRARAQLQRLGRLELRAP